MKTAKQVRRDAKRLFRLCVVDGVLDQDRVRLVASRVAASGRAGTLPSLARFRRLVQLEVARRTAVVESASPLPEVTRAVIEAGLRRAHGPSLAITFAENPDLIAGVRIRIGGDVYDDSIRARLAAVGAAFES